MKRNLAVLRDIGPLCPKCGYDGKRMRWTGECPGCVVERWFSSMKVVAIVRPA